ncbi:hypothetical protein EG487_25580 [Paenibacillus polymyxa]|nr:hypothetical protein EG487_25580 [Paenibacillus polymyxa]
MKDMCIIWIKADPEVGFRVCFLLCIILSFNATYDQKTNVPMGILLKNLPKTNYINYNTNIISFDQEKEMR